MYIFYDTETSGLERDFAQVLQIALVVTDDDLNIVSSKKIECRLSPWVVPGAGALLTTHFTKDDLTNRDHSGYEMMQEIDQWIRAQGSPMIFGGFNTLGYDEDVFAKNLLSNMLDPALTQTAGNTRFDVLNAVQAVAAYMPGALKLDVLSEKGNTVMKLSVVAEQNGVDLSKEAAHDALNDIRATVGVARVVKTVAPKIWEHMHKLATKEGVDAFMAENDVFTHTAVFFGKNKPIVATSVALRGHRTQILFDVTQDPAPFLSMTPEQLKQVFEQQAKKPAKDAPPQQQFFRLVRKDQQPVMMPLDMSAAVLPAQFDEKIAAERAAAIKANKQFQENVRLAAQMFKDDKDAKAEQKRAAKAQAPAAPEGDAPAAKPKRKASKSASAPQATTPPPPKTPEVPEERMQEIFRSIGEWQKEFRTAPSWKDRVALADGFAARFAAEIAEYPPVGRMATYATRIIFENAPEALGPQRQLDMKREIAATVLDPDPEARWTTVGKALKEIADIEKDRAEKKKNKWDDVPAERLEELKRYYASIEKEYAPYLPAKANDNAPAAPAAAPAKPKKSGIKPR